MASAQPVPVAFVDWARVTQLLDTAATGGITSVLLFQQDGSLLASSRGAQATSAPTVSALISSVWEDYAAFGAGQDVQALLIDCTDGQVSVARVGTFLIALVADTTVQPGTTRGKMAALLAALQDLTRVYPTQN